MENAKQKTSEQNEEIILKERMGKIANKIVVLSGKGGVGKSTVSVNLAVSLAMQGYQVGLLDVDVHGPSIPTMLGLHGIQLVQCAEGIYPHEMNDLNNLRVISVGFILEESDSPVIWRGPMKNSVIKQFLKDVDWGKLDYLIVDCPPGTGDEPLSVIQMLGSNNNAVIVTTPQQVSSIDVSKSINFCHKLSLPIVGIIENMSGFVCPECKKITHIFQSGGGKKLAEKYNIPFLGSIPIDPAIGDSCDNGTPYVRKYKSSPTAEIYSNISKMILKPYSITSSCKNGDSEVLYKKKENHMKIAIPVANGLLNTHFGHCESFSIYEVDENDKKILSIENITAPPHEPGLLPKWLGERGVNMIIAGGMGQKAQTLFAERNIKVLIGAPSEKPGTLVNNYLDGSLKSGVNVCDH